ncbi:hypothetical protein AAFF_G00078850 [Aldrovandia affinis]|uniref:Uncharacterized protein n=1 Tax=Aldrovandia affinis TaxID=143900 RepID=A0AAD7RX89_9TELE|nr:hypothetical protein AAFF_G00078850 [Aldrovandia affinis]
MRTAVGRGGGGGSCPRRMDGWEGGTRRDGGQEWARDEQTNDTEERHESWVIITQGGGRSIQVAVSHFPRNIRSVQGDQMGVEESRNWRKEGQLDGAVKNLPPIPIRRRNSEFFDKRK